MKGPLTETAAYPLTNLGSVENEFEFTSFRLQGTFLRVIRGNSNTQVLQVETKRLLRK